MTTISNVEKLFIFELLESLSPDVLGELVESCSTAVKTIDVLTVDVDFGLSSVAVKQIELVEIEK